MKAHSGWSREKTPIPSWYQEHFYSMSIFTRCLPEPVAPTNDDDAIAKEVEHLAISQ
jgi:hypothetical protein